MLHRLHTAKTASEYDRPGPKANVMSGYPLALASEGEQVTVSALSPGKRFGHRLMELGLAPGTELTVLKNDGQGPLLLAIRDTRLAIGAGMAHKITVIPTGA